MNDDDRFLRELAQVANDEKQAEEARLDERWDRLSAGGLSAEEQAALRALAETSEDARGAYEAFRPLGPEFQARVMKALRDQSAPVMPEADVVAPAIPAEPPPRVLPFRRRALRLGGWLAAAAPIAAVLLLMFRGPGALPPLPDYEPKPSGGVQAMRGAPEELGTLVPGSTFDLVLQPLTAVSGEVAVRCFLARGARDAPDTELRPLPVPGAAIRHGSSGALRIHGTVGREIKIPRGEWTLWAVVGRPRELPDAAALRAHLAQGRPRAPDWTALKIALKAE
jgi:hypothetical protein